MPQPRSSSSSSRAGGKSAAARRSSGKRAASTSKTAGGSRGAGSGKRSRSNRRYSSEGLANLLEQLVNRIIKPLGLVMLTRERIQETLDEAAERGRVTRTDANELVTELVRRGRQQTDDLLADFEQLVGRGRGQLGSATKRARRAEPVDQLVRAADRARRSVGVGSSFPISGYDELTASQVTKNLTPLTPAELRRVRDYEARHANRKSVLDAIEKALSPGH